MELAARVRSLVSTIPGQGQNLQSTATGAQNRERSRPPLRSGCQKMTLLRLRVFGFKGLAPLLAAFFDHFFVGSEGLLGVLGPTGAPIGLAQLEVGEIAIGHEFLGLLEARDGAFDVPLLQERATELEVGQLVVGLGLNYLAQQAGGVLRMTEGE